MRPREQARVFAADLGTPAAAASARRLLAHGPSGGAALLRVISEGLTLGPPDANGRAVMEDLEAFFVDYARACPDDFLRLTAVAPHATSFAVASALRVIQSPASDERLLALLAGRDGTLRWLALGALLERRSLVARARLPALLGDRDGLVVFVAARALRRWGGVDALAKLRALAAAKRTAPGTREAAYDAIEAICARASRPLPRGRGSPPPRLVEVALCEGAAVVVDVEEGVIVLRRVGRARRSRARSSASSDDPC